MHTLHCLALGCSQSFCAHTAFLPVLAIFRLFAALATGSSTAVERRCGSAGGSGSSTSDTLELVSAAAAELQAVLQRREEDGCGTGASPSLALLRRYQAELLPPAARLAEALQEHWAQPEQQAAAWLELGQALAVRSCAYLRCANLGGGGGPDAGQGEGSRRCGGCRAVWYCGTACSHADWGCGGWHKKVCRALAAARQAGQQGPGPPEGRTFHSTPSQAWQ
ncbi:hypothetical protein ABPG75_012439 [Micractinium tetrahymenae]